MKKRLLHPWVWVLGVVVVSIAVLWPLVHSGYYVSDDGEWMVIRLSAFYQSLSSGQFPVRFLGRLNNSYGYPVANFLYPGFLYIGSLLHVAGVSFPDAVKLIMGMSVVGGALFVFFALRNQHGNHAGFFGAVSFLCAPYLLYDLYHRGSVGEVFAMLPATALIYGLSAGVFWLIPPALAILLISHNTTALIIGTVFVLLVLTKKRPLRFAWHILLGFGMAAFFWIPAVFEQSYIQFGTAAATVSDPLQYFVSFPHAMLLGIPTVLSIVVLFGLKRKHSAWDMMICLLIVFGYCMALPLSAAVWRIPILTKLVQFPYRFLIIPVVLGPWVIAQVWQQLKGWRKAALFGVFVMLWLQFILLQESSIQFVNRPIGYYTTNEGTTTVANEYMPVWVSETPKQRMADMIDVISGNVNLVTRRFSRAVISTTVIAKTEGIVQINKVYYPGWRVAIDGVPVQIDYENSFGFMRVAVPEGTHHMKAAFRETPFRLTADVISVLSVIVYLVLVRKLQKST